MLAKLANVWHNSINLGKIGCIKSHFHKEANTFVEQIVNIPENIEYGAVKKRVHLLELDTSCKTSFA